MDSDVRILQRELWDIMLSDGGKSISELRSIRKREDRRGRVKRLLCRAIDTSSLGLFNGMLYYFGGRVYVSITTRAFKKVLYDIMSMRIELPDADLVRMSDIYDDCLNAVYSKPLSISAGVMVFRNGVLDLDKGEFHRRIDKSYVQMWSVDYDYVPSARTFLWYQFLNQVLPDKYLQDVLQMFLGATFIDRSKVKIETILILLGKGANGKSVIQRAVCGVLGEDYVATQEVGRLCSRGIDGDEAVALINGKRLNYCTEMESTDFYKKSARLKAIVSGEKVPARFRYGIGFEAMNIPLLMANANQLPIFNRRDDAMLRRLYVVPFSIVIPPERQNKTLNDELVSEYPGILNWILEGRQKFIDNGYKLPEDINAEKYLREEATEYIQPLKYMEMNGWRSTPPNNVQMEAVTWKRLVALYAGYDRWSRMNGFEPLTKTVFANVLENQGGFQRRRAANGIEFAVFGQVTLTHLRKETEKLRGAKKVNPKAAMMWVDGKPWITSQKALAAYAGVTYTVVMRLAREGKFEPYTKAWKEKRIYDVEACCQLMRELRVIASDEEKEIQTRISQELKYFRNNFNRRMEYNNLPYRKYSSNYEQIEEGIIVVPDEISDDEIYKMAVEAGYDMSHWERFGKGKGAFSRRGKAHLVGTGEAIKKDEDDINK